MFFFYNNGIFYGLTADFMTIITRKPGYSEKMYLR